MQTLHDLIPLVFDDADLQVARRRLAASATRYREAPAVIAVSRYSADEGIRVFGLDASRVHVIHHAADTQFTPGPAPDGGGPYLLLVSGYDPRKGYTEAFAVIAALAAAGYPHRLRVVGSLPEWRADLVEDLRARSGAGDRIDLLGFAPDIVGLYRGASAVIVTSRYEGFGLPALEAMACGRPVVAFANSSLPEVVGDGGLLVPDGDVEAFVKATRRVLDDDSLAADLSARAVARAATFTPARFADDHVDVYRSVAR